MKFTTFLFLISKIAFIVDASSVRGMVSSPSGGVGQRRHLDKDEPSERECEIEIEVEEISFECEAKTEDDVTGTEIEDEIKFKVKTSDSGIRVKIEYEEEIETEEKETETETQFEVVFDEIVEYVSDGGAFDWESNEVVQRLPLTSWAGFSAIEDDGTVASFDASSADGHATFTFTITRADTTTAVGRDMGGQGVSANKMKIDFRLENFPWLRNDTYVALMSTVESVRSVEVEYEDRGDEKAEDVIIDFSDVVDIDGFTPFGEFTWERTATASNSTNSTEPAVTIQVVATSPTSGDSEQSIAFSFLGDNARQASDIFWDPEAGVGYGGSGVSKMAASIGAIALAVSSVALLAF